MMQRSEEVCVSFTTSRGSPSRKSLEKCLFSQRPAGSHPLPNTGYDCSYKYRCSYLNNSYYSGIPSLLLGSGDPSVSGTSRARSSIDEESKESKRASFKCDNRFRSSMQKSRALLPVFLTMCGGSDTSEFISVVEILNVELITELDDSLKALESRIRETFRLF